MSKQSDAKLAQGYIPKVIPATCGNCNHCVAVMGDVLVYKDPKRFSEGTHMASQQVGQACGLGGFSVKKLGTCQMHQAKP